MCFDNYHLSTVVQKGVYRLLVPCEQEHVTVYLLHAKNADWFTQHTQGMKGKLMVSSGKFKLCPRWLDLFHLKDFNRSHPVHINSIVVCLVTTQAKIPCNQKKNINRFRLAFMFLSEDQIPYWQINLLLTCASIMVILVNSVLWS